MNIILFLLGLGLFGLGLFTLKKSLYLSKQGVSVSSNVIKVEKRAGSDEDGYKTISYVPILEYIAKDKTYTLHGESSKNKNAYKVGDNVQITYDPNNPHKAIVKSFNSLWLTPGILILVGALLAIAAFLA